MMLTDSLLTFPFLFHSLNSFVTDSGILWTIVVYFFLDLAFHHHCLLVELVLLTGNFTEKNLLVCFRGGFFTMKYQV